MIILLRNTEFFVRIIYLFTRMVFFLCQIHPPTQTPRPQIGESTSPLVVFKLPLLNYHLAYNRYQELITQHHCWIHQNSEIKPPNRDYKPTNSEIKPKKMETAGNFIFQLNPFVQKYTKLVIERKGVSKGWLQNIIEIIAERSYYFICAATNTTPQVRALQFFQDHNSDTLQLSLNE